MTFLLYSIPTVNPPVSEYFRAALVSGKGNTDFHILTTDLITF